MASAIHPCLLLCLLLLAPHLGSCYHTISTYGGRRQVVLRSSDHDSWAPSTCAPVHSGDGVLSVTHRLSPCSSSYGGDTDQSMPTVSEIFNSDALRLRALSGSPSETSGVTIPLTGILFGASPGVSEYHVNVGFGTPVQNLTVGFDTATVGATLLTCKPCAGLARCERAFDPSISSSLAQISCSSYDCPLKACSEPTCTIAVTKNGYVLQNATFVTDTLTVTPSIAVDDVRVGCLEMIVKSVDRTSGVLDLSRESHSLASRFILSPETVAFSYCLPPGGASPGFLSFGTTRPENAGNNVTYTTLQNNAARPNLYFVKLIGISIGGFEIPVPPVTITGDTLMEVHTTFTYLKPEVYVVLRDKFREWMKGYPVAPSSGELDTCYDFRHQTDIEVPIIKLEFEGGAVLDMRMVQMMYSRNRHNPFSVACLAFAPVPTYAPGGAVIGSMAQSEKELVYDLLGGKLGFVANRC